MPDETIVNEETRCRMGAKLTAKGLIQFDLTAEAPTVKKAEEILSEALDEVVRIVKIRGFDIVKA